MSTMTNIVAADNRERFFVLGAAVAHFALQDVDRAAPRYYIEAVCGRRFEWSHCSWSRAGKPLCGNCARGTTLLAAGTIP